MDITKTNNIFCCHFTNFNYSLSILFCYLLMHSMAHELRIGLHFSVLVSHLCMQIYACIYLSRSLKLRPPYWILQEGAVFFLQTLWFFPSLMRCESTYQYFSSLLRFWTGMWACMNSKKVFLERWAIVYVDRHLTIWQVSNLLGFWRFKDILRRIIY